LVPKEIKKINVIIKRIKKFSFSISLLLKKKKFKIKEKRNIFKLFEIIRIIKGNIKANILKFLFFLRKKFKKI
tara:strand:- start:321 stop:539 length:219 start_codon:yes stop_codon:yes gene_type:complete